MEVLRTNILKTYSAIEAHRVKWNEIISSVEVSLKTLSGLTDQLDCVLKTQTCELLRKFAYLKDQLEQTICALIEEELASISLSLEELSMLNMKLRNSQDVSYKSYLEDYVNIQADPAFYRGTNLYPPLCQMIEWMDDINICYATRLTIAKHMLEIFDNTPQSLINLQNTLDSRSIFSTVEEIMVKMSIFLQEK